MRSRSAGWLAFVLAVLWPGPALAQQGTIAGRVMDVVTQAPLVNVQVFVNGTQRGAVTDQQGRFTISNVPPGTQQVTAALIGYAQEMQSVTVQPGGRVELTFALRQSAVELDGIVVNAVTGEREQRRELGNTVGRIDVASLNKAALAKPADVLTGRIAGVEIRNINGTTGTGQRIRIRGANSISLSNEPLIIVDGVRFDNSTEFLDSDFSEGLPDQVPNRFNDINFDDIESVEVLKGPAAVGVYGTAASNGVVLITTKRGAAGDTRWSFYAEGGVVQERNDYPDNLVALSRAADGSMSHCQNFLAAMGACTQDTIIRYNPFEDDAIRPFRDGSRQKYGMGVSGGSDRFTYYLSGDVERENGVYTSNELDKTTARANLRAQMRDNLTFTVASAYASSDFSQPSNDNSVLSPILNSMFGRARWDRSNPNRAYFRFNNEVTTERYFATQEVERFTGSLTANWQPFAWLAVNATGGLDSYSLHDTQVLEPNVAPIAETWVNGWAEESRASNFQYTANGASVASFQLTPRINSRSTVGVDYNKQKLGATRAKGFGLTPGVPSLDGTSSLFAIDEDNSEIITIGGFVQQQFSLDGRLFVSGAVRADDNSAFGQDFGLVYYPSVSVSWVISEEPFFPRSDFLSSVRLRGALGESGQRPQFRQAETYYSPATAATPNGDEPGVTIGGTGNLDLKPERTREYEVGFDLGLVRDRFAAEFTYYRRDTRDALIARNLPPSVGQTNPATGSGTRFENIGRVRNQGVEVALNARIIEADRLRWNLRVSGNTLDNEILDLGEGIDPILFNRGAQRHIAGHPAGGYWQPQVTWNDADGNGLLGLDEIAVGDSLSFIGPSLPKYMGALSTDVELFNVLRVSALLEGRAGHYSQYYTEDLRCTFSLVTSDRGCDGFDDPAAPLADQAAAIADLIGDPNTGAVSTAGLIHKADFVKWRELAFTLTPPREWADRLGTFSGLSLTIAGRNLYTWTDYPGLDPEVNETGSSSNFTQNEFGSQPQVRYWTARINFTF